MPGFHFNEMGELVLSAVEDVSVVDVYDLASDIGKECEKIIDLFGADSVTSLMPKVINALEMLEAMASRNERENSVVQELTDRITQLESEKIEKAIFRERFQKEIESIEEQWRSESRELVAMVNRLQEENRRIQKDQTTEGDGKNASIAPADNTTTPNSITNESSTNFSSSPTDLQMLQRMRAQLDKTRNESKQKDNSIEEKRSEIENLHLQLDRLKVSGREIRKRQKLFQMQVRTLCEERADFLAQLQDQHREILTLRKRLGIAEKENEDLSLESLEDDPNRPRFTTTELKDLINERDTLKSKIVDLEELLGQTEGGELISAAGDETEKQPPKLEEQGFLDFQKTILQSRGRYRLSQTMLPGKKPTKRESGNFFASYFPNKEVRDSLVARYLHYLKWLCLLALVTSPSECRVPNATDNLCKCSLRNPMNFLLDSTGNLDIWFIK